MKIINISLLLIITLLLLSSCGGKGTKSLDGAGATFPFPFYSQVFSDYADQTGIQVNYGSIGSGGGIRSLRDKVVDFGGTDSYLSDERIAEMPGEIVHIPTLMGAVVLAYNLEGVDELKLTPALVEGVFLGKITRWNDSLMQENNPGAQLPDLKITVVHRSDGSGTTHIFSDYLSKVGPEWNEKVGVGNALEWPVGIGGQGNPGVSGAISQTQGAIGYINSEYAFAQNIPMAMLQNKAGYYIKPSAESISAAAKGDLPADTRTMLTNMEYDGAYPICGFTWIIIYKEQAYDDRTKEKALETLKLLQWMISKEPQSVTSKLHYAPLPQEVVESAQVILESVTYQGEPLL